MYAILLKKWMQLSCEYISIVQKTPKFGLKKEKLSKGDNQTFNQFSGK